MPKEQEKEKSHSFVVTVSGCSAEQADRVIAERVSFDENYGFPYTIGYRPVRDGDEADR